MPSRRRPSRSPFAPAFPFAALALAALACGPAAQHAGDPESADGNAPQTLPFIEDDPTRALAEARERKLPLFVEAWAPW